MGGPYRPRLGKAELAQAIAAQHGLPTRTAERIVFTMFEEIFKSLSMGIPVTITNFGSLKPYEDRGQVMFIERPGSAPMPVREFDHDPQLSVMFRPAPRMLDAMNNAETRQTIRRYPGTPRKLGRHKKGKRT